MTNPIGLIGLGAMGGAMANRLIETGHDVVGFDVLPEASQRASRDGVRVVDDPKILADECAVIILSLPKAAFVTEVMAKLAPDLAAGSIILDTTTSEPATSRTIAHAAKERGVSFLDAPVSGGPHGARTGTMTMVVGGDGAALDQVRSLLEHMTAKLIHIGPSGAGNAAKIANNLLCAANLVLVSEMVHMAERVGVSAEDLLAGLNAGSGRSGVSEVNFPRWILNSSYDSGFTMGLMRKDVGLAQNLARELGLDLPGTDAIATIWEDSRKKLPDSADFNEIYRYET